MPQSSLLDIRVAKPEDLTQIISFGYKSFNENNLKDLCGNPSYEKVVKQMSDWVVNHTVLVKRNSENDKLIDGVLTIEHSEVWWSSDACLMIGLFFVPKEKRNFKLAVDFLKAAQEYAIMLKLPLVIDLIGETDVKGKRNLLKYCGFKEYGSSFIFSPKTITTEIE